MNLHFQALETRIKRRQRFLNALTTTSDWAGLSLGLSLSYLVLVALGLLPVLLPLWALSLINIAIGLAGWLRGRLRPIDLGAALFQVDRALRTGEALCTYREFSGQRARAPFSWQLERMVEAIDIEPAIAMPLSQKPRRRLATVAGLTLACVWLASLGSLHLIPGSLLGWSTSPATSEKEQNVATVIPQAGAPQPLSSRELQKITTQAQQLEKQLQSAASPVDARAATAELQALYQKLNEAQQNLWKLPNTPSDLATKPTDQPSESSQLKPSADQSDDQARQLAEARQNAQALKDALDQLKQTLDQLQSQDQQDTASSEATQKELEQLAQQATNEAIRQSLQNAAQAGTSRAQREAIAKAQKQLQDLLKADQQLAQAQQQISQALREGGQRPSQSAQDSLTKGAAAPGQSNPQGQKGQNATDGTAQNKGDNQGEPGDKQTAAAGNQGKETAGQPSQEEAPQSGAESNQGGNQTTGNQPGTTDTAHPPEEPSDQTMPPQQQLVISHDHLPPDVNMQLLMRSKGVPFETVSSSTSGDLTLQYDFARAEALLKARGLPSDLRELVRQYFLAITAEPSQP